jgi:hypothetical protein
MESNLFCLLPWRRYRESQTQLQAVSQLGLELLRTEEALADMRYEVEAKDGELRALRKVGSMQTRLTLAPKPCADPMPYVTHT